MREGLHFLLREAAALPAFDPGPGFDLPIPIASVLHSRGDVMVRWGGVTYISNTVLALALAGEVVAGAAVRAVFI